MRFRDHFSLRASEYSRFRPEYPSELYAFVYRHVRRFEVSWDAGTSNGQAAVAFALSFGRVYANDASEWQIERAVKKENIEYSVSRSESVPIPSGSVDPITAAQALHWFRHGSFYSEVRRVSRGGSLIAAWAYGLASMSPATDPVLLRFNVDVIGPY